MTDALRDTTHIFGANSAYIAEIYERYLVDPSSGDESWCAFFENMGDNVQSLEGDFGGASWARDKTQIVGQSVGQSVGLSPKVEKRQKQDASRRKNDRASDASIRAHMLIRAYRVRGHLLANLDPLGLEVRKSHAELSIERYGFTEEDYGTEIFVGEWLSLEKATLREIMDILTETYCSNIGLEYIHIQSLERKEWLENKMESTRSKPVLTPEQKKNILLHLVEVVGFEEFLHTKFPGAKRFSIEGGENLIPAMETILDKSSELGVNEIVVGMPHRGRLNVLTAFMRKPYSAMLSEFQGAMATPEHIDKSGDVKYHLGKSTDRKLSGGREVHLSLTSNPSHLEAVNTVVNGKVRAKQDQKNDTERSQVLGLVLHGDASFCGQGVVAESLAFSDLDGFNTGGTVHIVVNNQVGFTTTPKEAHTSPYPTDVAKMTQAAIFHVNGDDPEAVIHACEIAAEFRQKFKKDVVIDLFCYRKRGHNEGDEPFFTQPIMYKKIAEKSPPNDTYARHLMNQGVITQEEYDGMKKEFRDFLEDEYTAAENYKPEKADWLEGQWGGLGQGESGVKKAVDTGVDEKILKKIGKSLSEEPDSVEIHSKIKRLIGNKKKMMETGQNIDWATGEALAFGSLLLEGKPIRLCGQDVIRGTFSHRHSAYTDQKTEELYFPLNHMAKKQAKLEAVNSNLSEYAVLGYEYGYSSAEPNALTIWEAQFGDFSNGAQIIIDQFISSGEVKWLRMSGLVMLLPHGFEGQGPEHSSARLERYLQMCAEDNMQVVNCTTPANYFHVLRRQLARNFRKPLIVMAPKSLLRHKCAVSSLKDMVKGTSFQRVIPETEKLVANAKVRRVVFCSGKVYYDLLEAREKKKTKDVALVRVEQYYPFPEEEIIKQVNKYKGAGIVWCQEEPENMGAWQFLDRRIEKALKISENKSKTVRYVGRSEAASPAVGYLTLHQKEQETLVKEALA